MLQRCVPADNGRMQAGEVKNWRMATALPRMAGALRLPFQGRISATKSSSPAKVFTVHGTQQKRASLAFVQKSAFAQGLHAGYASWLVVARPTRIVCPSKTYAWGTLELPKEVRDTVIDKLTSIFRD